jgi:hypothetical protein
MQACTLQRCTRQGLLSYKCAGACCQHLTTPAIWQQAPGTCIQWLHRDIMPSAIPAALWEQLGCLKQLHPCSAMCIFRKQPRHRPV